jgi:hypothetical protein
MSTLSSSFQTVINQRVVFCLLGALLGLSQCQKPAVKPEDQLPPATRTGANSFGCLVNGEVWTPSGNNSTSNYTITVDPTFHGGNVDIHAYRYTDNLFQSLIFGGDSIPARAGVYSLDKNPRSIYFIDKNLAPSCQYFYGDPGEYRRGSLTITRLDLQAGIIAGTFSFTLYTPGCDSIRVTQGRFDKKL